MLTLEDKPLVDLTHWLNEQDTFAGMPVEEQAEIKKAVAELQARAADRAQIEKAMVMVRSSQLQCKDTILTLILKYHKTNYPISGLLSCLVEKLEQQKYL